MCLGLSCYGTLKALWSSSLCSQALLIRYIISDSSHKSSFLYSLTWLLYCGVVDATTPESPISNTQNKDHGYFLYYALLDKYSRLFLIMLLWLVSQDFHWESVMLHKQYSMQHIFSCCHDLPNICPYARKFFFLKPSFTESWPYWVLDWIQDLVTGVQIRETVCLRGHLFFSPESRK